MPIRGRVILPLALVLGLTAGAAPAAGAVATSCSSASGSAIDQYCEVVPSSSGGRAPLAGQRALGATLPPGLQRRLTTAGPITASTSRAQRARRTQAHAGTSQAVIDSGLLALPAPVGRHATNTAHVDAPSPLSLLVGLIVALAIVAVGVPGLAMLMRRHR